MSVRSASGAERLARVYETLLKAGDAIVRVRERRPLFEQVCRVLVEEGQLRMAWVGEIDDQGWVEPVASAGAVHGYLDGIRISVRDIPEGRGPTGTAARELRHAVVGDIAQDERMGSWREAALARRFRSSAAFPLITEGRCAAVLTAYASEPGFFDGDEVRLFDRMAADLSFAVEAMEREARLRASEEQVRVAAESMLDAFTVLSPVRDARGEIVDFRYRYVNDAYCTLTQTARERLLGRCIGELYPGFAGSERFEVYRRVALTGEPSRADGVHGEVSWAGTPFADRVIDTVIAPMGEDLAMAARDVTERELARQELELRAELLDLAHDAVIVRDPADSRVRFWNREAEVMYGYSRAEAMGSITHDLLATEYPESMEAAAQALGRTGRWDGELRHARKDGRRIVVSSRQALARDADGRPLAIIELNSDITKRRRAEESLREAQAQLQAIFDHIPAGLALRDLDGRYLIVNDYLARSLDTTAAALAGRDPGEHLDADTRARIRDEDERMRRTREPVAQEFRVPHADGTDHTFHVVRYPVLDEHGEVSAFGSFSLDVTDRKRAEQELAYAQRLLERTEQLSKTGGWEYHLATGRLTWTDEVYRIYGIEKTPGPAEVAPAIAAYDRQSAPIIEAAFERLVSEGEPYDLELGLIRADGKQIRVRTIGRPVVENGRIVRVGGQITDVTERSRAERALRQARDELERAQRIAELGSFSTDARLEEMAWSAELYRIFGRVPADGPPRAAELHSYINPEDAAAARAAFAAATAGEEPAGLDVRVRVGDAAERILRVIVRRDPDRPGYCSGTAQDVTRVRATERALREQRERAESASQAKSEFLARMSHELRTPLNSIIGFSQLLQLEGLGQREGEHVTYVMKAGRHLLDLINEVLELTKIESGQFTLSPEPVLLANAVADALALVAPLAGQHEVTLDIDTDGLAHDGHVNADRQRLQQVLLNVLSNAIKYNRRGGCVNVRFAITEAGRVRTTIADTGIGIAAEQRPRLFEPFERLGAEVTQIEGTGLGLALSKRLIEAMGGAIEVDSREGAGTTVTIELAGAQRPTDTQPTDEHDHELDFAGPEGTRYAILYIEDNLSNLTLVERILDRYPDVDLIPAMQGTIGLELALQHRPDLIVLDLHLPDMPGTEVLTRLRADRLTREIPIVVLTADASHRQSERVQGLGAAAYLTKPIDVPRFLTVINENLNRTG